MYSIKFTAYTLIVLKLLQSWIHIKIWEYNSFLQVSFTYSIVLVSHVLNDLFRWWRLHFFVLALLKWSLVDYFIFVIRPPFWIWLRALSTNTIWHWFLFLQPILCFLQVTHRYLWFLLFVHLLKLMWNISIYQLHLWVGLSVIVLQFSWLYLIWINLFKLRVSHAKFRFCVEREIML